MPSPTTGHPERPTAGFLGGFIAAFACLIAASVAQAQPEPAPSDPALAEPGGAKPRYRIELLIFRHLDSMEEGLTETELRDFSSALDLLSPPETAPEADAPAKPAEPSKPHSNEASSRIEAQVPRENEAEEPIEPPVVLVEQQSEAMQHAWRRLRGSAGFRPEQFMAWEQSMAEPPPFIRVHDLELLKEIDPLTGLPPGEAAAAETSGEPIEFNDTTKRPYETVPKEDPGESPEVGADGEESVLVPPNIRFYRIDGSSRLRRSRFLHLDLDIEFREPELRQPELRSPGAASMPATTTEPVTESPESPQGSAETAKPAWVVHKLSQSRQVQLAKYEYFDGPHFALLALVTRIDALSTQEPGTGELATGEAPAEDTQP